ncbi:nucleotidyltransferase [candidate division WOR-3 bacterium 4484_100]|uniref:Nucleotidyltransferase n=1 Tax=candidate division WOR-3 bacterium 4484_100 TaxID=1936077 RepID=A0A1V4QDT1_UNCW3|nr:MAG: nucleotidyltransferase [candidate division WOR-3 bacterium 4484_100]
MKTIEEIKKILTVHKKEMMRLYKIKEIEIFGSYVRNEQKKRSDVDIIIDFYEVPDLFKFIEIEEYLENLLGIKVDLVRKPVLRAELKDKILSEAVKI